MQSPLQLKVLNRPLKDLVNIMLGQDSPTLKLCYLKFILLTFQCKTLVEEKTVIVELGESQPWGIKRY